MTPDSLFSEGLCGALETKLFKKNFGAKTS